jgi:hypothetical protein
MCTDINECDDDPEICGMNANCTNTVGSYTCSCSSGYTGDGIMCTDINECDDDPEICGMNANCTNTVGSYMCSCSYLDILEMVWIHWR